MGKKSKKKTAPGAGKRAEKKPETTRGGSQSTTLGLKLAELAGDGYKFVISNQQTTLQWMARFKGNDDMVAKTRQEYEQLKSCDEIVAKVLKEIQDSSHGGMFDDLDGFDDLAAKCLKKLEDTKSYNDRMEEALEKFENSKSDTTLFQSYDDLAATYSKKYEESKSCWNLSKQVFAKLDDDAQARKKIKDSKQKSELGTTNIGTVGNGGSTTLGQMPMAALAEDYEISDQARTLKWIEYFEGNDDMEAKTRKEFEDLKSNDEKMANTFKTLQDYNLEGFDNLLAKGLKKLEDTRAWNDRLEKALKKFEHSKSETMLFEYYDDLALSSLKKFKESKAIWELLREVRDKLDDDDDDPGSKPTTTYEDLLAKARMKAEDSKPKSESGTTNVGTFGRRESWRGVGSDDELLSKKHNTPKRKSERSPPASPDEVPLISAFQNLELSTEAETKPIKTTRGRGGVNEAIFPKTKSGTEFHFGSRNEKKISNASQIEKKIPNQVSGNEELSIDAVLGYDASLTSIEACFSTKSSIDAIGRMFCKHHRDYCHICRVDFRHANRLVEEGAGLRKKETKLEVAARMVLMAKIGLKKIESLSPRPSKEQLEMLRMIHDMYNEQISDLYKDGASFGIVQTAFDRIIDREKGIKHERIAIITAMTLANPGKTYLRIGGEESQKVYDNMLKLPEAHLDRADYYTCAYCGKTGTEKLHQCSRCKKVSYCRRECQVAAWPCHKKLECVKICDAGKEPKKLSLTWDQVEAYAGEPARGKLVVRYISIDDYGRHVCLDRVGKFRPIIFDAFLENPPGLMAGAIVTWKNPRYIPFFDEVFSGGARIKKEDMKDVVFEGGWKFPRNGSGNRIIRIDTTKLF